MKKIGLFYAAKAEKTSWVAERIQKEFGESHIDEVAAKYGIKNIARMPINPKLAAACDKGLIELYDGNWLDETTDMLEKL